MNREIQVRFREEVGVKFPLPYSIACWRLYFVLTILELLLMQEVQGRETA